MLSDEQERLSFDGDNLVIIDEIDALPDNTVYNLDRILLLLCTKGRIQIEYDGHPVTIRQQELFVGSPGSTVSDYMVTPDFQCKAIIVRQEEVTSTLETHITVIKNIMRIKTMPVRTLTDGELQTIYDYYHLLCRQIQNTGNGCYNITVCLLLNSLILNIAGLFTTDGNLPEDETRSVHGSKIVETFIQMVNEDCGRTRQVETYAERLHITPKYLSTLVRASLQRTPTDVIRVVTVKEIERQLRYTDRSIKQISAQMQFPNASFFGRYFKKNTGMPPNEYRSKYHK